jgi:hypothetical protein
VNALLEARITPSVISPELAREIPAGKGLVIWLSCSPEEEDRT